MDLRYDIFQCEPFVHLHVQQVVVNFLEISSIQHLVDDVLDVRFQWVPNARVDRLLGYVLVTHPGGLENVEHFTHVTLGQSHQGFFPIIGYFKSERGILQMELEMFTIDSLFFFDDMLQPGQDLFCGEWSESEASATRLEGWNDLGLVVADDAESHVVRVLLNYYLER